MNLIEINQDKIKLSTLDEDYKYAFYLYHKRDVERIMYQDRSHVTFDLKGRSGYFKAVFFKKDISNNITVENEYFYVKDQTAIQVSVTDVAESEDFKITLYDIQSDIVFIVFNTTNSDKNTTPFGLSFLISKGYSVISCNQNNDQYQGLSFEQFKEIVTPLIIDKKVFLYGSSLGGYCAVYYAGAVNGTVITAAPRNSAHPKMIELDQSKTYAPEGYRHKDIQDNPHSNKRVYVFLDPYQDRDVFFLEEFIIPVYRKSLQVLEFPYAGHEVLFHINKTEQLSKIIISIVKNDAIDFNRLDFEKDSEFTLYSKLELKYKEFLDILKHYEKIKDPNPLIIQRISNLKERIKKI